MSTFRHSGEIGDIIYILPLLRAIGGKNSIYLVDRVTVPPFSRPIVQHLKFISKLLLKQPYISKIEATEKDADFNILDFRAFHEQSKTLTSACVAYYNFKSRLKLSEDGSEPWLSVGKRNPSGRVVISRSSRYNNPKFKWGEIVEHYGKRIQFIGLPHEHNAFVKKYGNVKHEIVDDLFKMATVINNSELFIGNQSAPLSVAMGLGVPIIEEVFIRQPDCIFKRKNVQYCYDGGCELPDVGGSGKLEIPPADQEVDFNIHREFTPGIGWQWPGLRPTPIFNEVLRSVMQLESCTKEEADRKIVTHNFEVYPDFFTPVDSHMNDSVNLAIKNAFGASLQIQ
jgi:hypothetical protein